MKLQSVFKILRFMILICNLLYGLGYFSNTYYLRSILDEKFEYKILNYVLHFFQVTYSVTGFIDKNNDILHRDLSQAMYRTEQPLLKTLFPEGKIHSTKIHSVIIPFITHD